MAPGRRKARPSPEGTAAAAGIPARLGAQGRLVLPSEVREAVRLRTGDRLLVVVEEDGILLLTPAQGARRAQAIVRRHVPQGRDLVEELLEERRREARGG